MESLDNQVSTNNSQNQILSNQSVIIKSSITNIGPEQKNSELIEPSQRIKSSPFGLIISFSIIVILFIGGYKLHLNQIKQSPYAIIIQTQTDMQKTEGLDKSVI